MCFFLARCGTDFARSGAVVVIIALCIEARIQKYLKDKKSLIEKGYVETRQQVANSSKPNSKFAKYIPEKFKLKKLAELDESIGGVHIHVLIMGVLGTLVWGFGDMLYLMKGFCI